jgi:hypothetical protein
MFELSVPFPELLPGDAPTPDSPLRDLGEWITSLPPGAGLAALLGGIDVAELTPLERVDLLTAYERPAAWVAAGQQQVFAALDARPMLDDDSTREEVGAALRLSSVTAGRRLDAARELTGRLPDTLAMLAAGQLTYLQAAAIAESTAELDADDAAAVQAGC